MARKWIKLWVAESLRGTMRFDFTPAERGVWYDLIILAGDCRQDGLIAPGKDQNYPLRWIGGVLNISSSLLDKTLKKCKTHSRIEVNSNGIRILNWGKYQSEYERQKPFREAKTPILSYNKVTTKVTNSAALKLLTEGEGEGEGEKNNPLPPKLGGDVSLFKLPSWIDKETWGSYLEMRRAKKAVPTPGTTKLIVKKLAKFQAAGHDVKEILEQSIINNWTGVFPISKNPGHERLSRGNAGQRPAGAFDDIAVIEKARGIPGNEPAGAFDDILG